MIYQILFKSDFYSEARNKPEIKNYKYNANKVSQIMEVTCFTLLLTFHFNIRFTSLPGFTPVLILHETIKETPLEDCITSVLLVKTIYTVTFSNRWYLHKLLQQQHSDAQGSTNCRENINPRCLILLNAGLIKMYALP